MQRCTSSAGTVCCRPTARTQSMASRHLFTSMLVNSSAAGVQQGKCPRSLGQFPELLLLYCTGLPMSWQDLQRLVAVVRSWSSAEGVISAVSAPQVTGMYHQSLKAELLAEGHLQRSPVSAGAGRQGPGAAWAAGGTQTRQDAGAVKCAGPREGRGEVGGRVGQGGWRHCARYLFYAGIAGSRMLLPAPKQSIVEEGHCRQQHDVIALQICSDSSRGVGCNIPLLATVK